MSENDLGGGAAEGERLVEERLRAVLLARAGALDGDGEVVQVGRLAQNIAVFAVDFECGRVRRCSAVVLA